MVLGNTQKVKNLIYYVQRARTVDVQPGARSCCGVFGVFPTRSALPNKAFSPFTVFRHVWAVFTLHRPINQKDLGLFFHPFILTILGLFLRNFLERR